MAYPPRPQLLQIVRHTRIIQQARQVIAQPRVPRLLYPDNVGSFNCSARFGDDIVRWELTRELMLRAIANMPDESWLKKFVYGPLQPPAGNHFFRSHYPVVRAIHWSACHGTPLRGGRRGNFISSGGNLLTVEAKLSWELNGRYMETIIFATLDDRADFVEQFSNKSLNRLGATCVEVPVED